MLYYVVEYTSLYRYIIEFSCKIYIQENQHLNQKLQCMCLKIYLKYLSHEEVDIMKKHPCVSQHDTNI